MANHVTSVSKEYGDILVKAEFDRSTGRLRIMKNGVVVAESFPPHSWMTIASAAGGSTWGTSPSERDLIFVLDQHRAQPYAWPKADGDE